ncbi:HlyD family type I secretion periplasmic adaptor subunit [Phyllobacterium sophorae]|jgi:HlyD family type I secretion membrane fusion protein|uniref:Membrane fusion protein (MFP) family protein n=1 Tax=Phyllobacterium sophorae TaxID=1520277 RepID=A0A2P7B456_9HYPH|nr:HlyD family type I secretion periplasmic adaptor subunit [Phyllobacterium sophorae]PSH61253.1 HlyD family type I secretion periplasmic adaptor subunit [Phyllobacterium sophorae]
MFGRNQKNERSPLSVETDSSFPVATRVFAGVTLGVFLFVGAGGWAATAQLTGAVIAPGMVKVDQNMKSIQHRDGGIVSEIAVKEGDFVEKGQIMLRLDDAQTRAELSIVRTQLVELMARQARLMAERDNLDAIILSPELAPRLDDFQHVFFGENRLFEGNRQNRQSQKGQLELGIDQLGEEIRGLESQRNSKVDEIALVKVEHDKIKGLTDKRLIETSRKYIIDREMAKLVGEKGEVEASIARAKAKMSEIRIQIIAIDETARTEAQRELSSIEPKLSELRERRVAIEDRLARTDIRAPLSGTVNELAIHTIGGVISPAEKLVTLVPADAALKIEAKLSPTDIDQVFVGQPAKLRFSAFNQRTTPELHGSVAYVSAATSSDPSSGQVYYLADVVVPADELEKLGDAKLLPGMPVEVFVSTEERTAMSFLSKPLADQFNRAFREQ